MKKILKFLMAFVLTFVFTMGISHADEDTFKVGMEVNYAPFNFSQVNDANGAVEMDMTFKSQKKLLMNLEKN